LNNFDLALLFNADKMYYRVNIFLSWPGLRKEQG